MLTTKPLGQNDNATTAELLIAAVRNSAPIIVAGDMRTPAQARQAIARGLIISPE